MGTAYAWGVEVRQPAGDVLAALPCTGPLPAAGAAEAGQVGPKIRY